MNEALDKTARFSPNARSAGQISFICIVVLFQPTRPRRSGSRKKTQKAVCCTAALVGQSGALCSSKVAAV
eukprot:1160533-Pelagomonas_calceolata.AAC.23